MSTIKVNSIEPANAGSEDYFLCKAWVNFNGKGTIAIRDDGNISSITDLGTGYYTATMANGMSDANYACPSISSTGSTDPSDGHLAALSYTSSVVRARCYTSGTSAYDQYQVSVSVFA